MTLVCPLKYTRRVLNLETISTLAPKLRAAFTVCTLWIRELQAIGRRQEIESPGTDSFTARDKLRSGHANTRANDLSRMNSIGFYQY